ncbi:hypothetical protein ONE63_005844 [Megalurothrips usitatus]|uniref:NOC3-like protein n=1 Tax=Megalurothrips usitatus TaxID=439358 RepID=A0AAV7XWT9_9NEOP|nr:hypothetical protein ONE63_005844 [Megalurothrips usitatus]
MSSVKLSNKNKQGKSRQGKANGRQSKKTAAKAQAKGQANQLYNFKIPLVRNKIQSEGGEEVDKEDNEDKDDAVEKDQLEILRQSMSKRSYKLLEKIRAPIAEDDGAEDDGAEDDSAEDDDEDDDVESAYYADNNTEGKHKKLMLPIKTSKGLVVREIEVDECVEFIHLTQASIPDVAEPDAEAEVEEEQSDSENDPESSKASEDNAISTAELLACREEILKQRKLRIGILCSGLLENPEGRLGNFRHLLKMMDEDIPEVKLTVRKLVTVSLLEVFKDVLPTYLIHVIDDKSVKMKKETLEIKRYEGGLLDAYKTYLTKLEDSTKCLIAKRKKTNAKIQGAVQLGELAAKCMADLFVNNPYFNFSVNLAQCLVKFLDNSFESVRNIAKEAIQRVFKEDKRGSMTLQIVRRINALVKNREQIANTEVLEVLLALRIKDINLDKEKEDFIEQEKAKAKKMRLLANTSRRDKKREKKMKELERDLQATNAEEDRERKHKDLTEVVKVVFMIYFRILKKEPNSRLLSVALEGLAKFSSCINLDYYHDLVNALDELMSYGDLKYRDQLHIVQTVFTILSGQGEMLTIDPRRFYTYLYRNMLNIHAGVTHPDMMILVRAIDYMMIKRRKKITQERAYAFTKRLSTLALQLLHNGSLSCLSLIKTVLQLNKSIDLLLDVDKSFGQGIYDPLLQEPEYCNAGNSTLWELSLLQRHYHPLVQQYSNFVSAGAPETGTSSLPVEFAKLSAEEFFTDYDGSKMAFKPAIPPPKKVEPKQRPSKYYIANTSLDQQIKTVLDSIPSTGNFFKALKRSV